mgnify:CR=1 FL=1
MLPYLLCEDDSHFDLLPFTYTRPLWLLRAGIYTSLERWQAALGPEAQIGGMAFGYLQTHFNQLPAPQGEAYWVNGKCWPEAELLRRIEALEPRQACLSPDGSEVWAARFSIEALPADHDGRLTPELIEQLGLRTERLDLSLRAFRFPEDLFRLNAEAIAFDFPLVTQAAPSAKLSDPYTRIYGADNLYVAPGAQARAALINAEDGPVYLGPEVAIGEGAIVHGSHAFGAHSKVSMGAKLRGDSAFGPYVKVGGEVGNSVIMGYSNKGHDGYLGNSVLGYWCNLGADTNTSNLKNNYAPIKVWHYPSGRFRDTGLQFCGLMMGDHSKAGINTMFNTGTVVGVSANIFGSGFPRTFIPSFAWGGASGFTTFQPRKAFEVAERVMARRKLPFTDGERLILQQVFDSTATHRRWEAR